MNERLSELVEEIRDLHNQTRPGEFDGYEDFRGYLASLVLYAWKSGDAMTIHTHMVLCDLFSVTGKPPVERRTPAKNCLGDYGLVKQFFRREMSGE